MPFSSGTFSVVYNWTTESGAPPIEIAKLDTQHADFATGLSNCILRDGSGLPTAAIPWNSQNLTGVAQLEAARFVPTGSTVPSNGMYLPAANTVAFASNTTLRASVNSSGNWTFAAPSSGASIASQGPITVTISSITQTIGNDGTGPFLDIAGANSWRLFTNSTQRVSVGAAGNVGIAAPSSGAALTVNGVSAGTAQVWGDGSRQGTLNFAASRMDFGSTTGDILSLLTAGSRRVEISAAGNVTIAAPSSGATLALSQVANTVGFSSTDGTRTFNLGTDTGGGSVYMGAVTTHNFDLYAGNVNRVRIGSAGNVTVNAPSSGTALTLNGLSGTDVLSISDGTRNLVGYLASTGTYIGSRSNHQLVLITNGTDRVTVAAAGNVTINAPSSGAALTVTALASGIPLQMADGTVTVQHIFTSSRYAFGTTTNHESRWYTNSVDRIQVNGSGNVTINAPSSGVALAVSGVSGTHSLTLADAGGTGGFKAGYLNIPQNSQSANYTLVLADAGKQILHPSGAGAGDTFTIPANSSVAYDVGTVITFVNLDTNAVSIAITTDTLTIAGTSTTGTRTLAQNGYATAIKVTSTSWLISGVGLS